MYSGSLQPTEELGQEGRLGGWLATGCRHAAAEILEVLSILQNLARQSLERVLRAGLGHVLPRHRRSRVGPREVPSAEGRRRPGRRAADHRHRLQRSGGRRTHGRPRLRGPQART